MMMRCDKNMLELAAKAASIEYNENYGKGFWIGEFYSGREWNPLTDDGDALRLALRLDMVVDMFAMEVRVKTGWSFGSPDFHTENIMYNTGDDMKATRRAIVRAAAEIGKEIK